MSAKASGPGIATVRHRGDAFAMLLKASETDGRTLASLALAYGGFAREAREALIEAVVLEADHPVDILAVFLAVEEEPMLAQRLAELMSVRPGAGRIEAEAVGRETPAGHEVSLIRPLHGSFAEIMRVRWNDTGVVGIDVESIIHLKELEPLPRIALSDALDRVCPPLWRHLRDGGRLPEGAERFAALFSLTEANADAAGGAAIEADGAAGTDAAVAEEEPEPG